MRDGRRSEVGGAVAAFIPVGLAIFVFGTIYGAAARPLLGAPLTLLSSALVFSGSVQFTLAALLAAGGAPIAAAFVASSLNVRNLLLGAVMRPRLGGSRAKRAGLGWFLTDEAVGLALASGPAAETTLFVAGLGCYVTWLGGTAVGLLGATLADVGGLAEAVFPVLFIGLAAVSATRLDVALRAVVAAAITVAIAVALPDLRSVAPVFAVVAVVVPGRR